MKKTVAKRATVLLAILVLLALSLSGLSVVAFAEGNPTVGAFVSWDGYTYNGTSADETENKTKISWFWEEAKTARMLLPIEGLTIDGTAKTIELEIMPDADATIRVYLFKNIAGSTKGEHCYVYDAALTKDTLFDVDYTMSTETIDAANINSDGNYFLALYFDGGVVSTEKKSVIVQKLTVAGVSYAPADYVAEVTAPEKSFKELDDWTVTNGTKSANTLEKLTGDEANGTVDNAAGNVTIADCSQNVSIEIPLSETISEWPTEWTNLYVKVKTENVNKIAGYIETVVEDNAFTNDLFGKAENDWQCSVSNSVSEGYKSISAKVNVTGAKYFEGYIAKGNTISKIILIVEFTNGATTASIEFGGMTFASTQPKFVNDISSPDLSIGEWEAYGYTLTPNSEITVGEGKDAVTYTGLKATYNSITQTSGYNMSVNLTNFDAAKHPMLRIGFYASHDVDIQFQDGTGGWDLLKAYETYKAGYNVVTFDMSAKTYTSFVLRICLDSNANYNGDEKTVLFDSITFYTPFNVAAQDSTAIIDGAVAIELQDTTDGSIQWTCETTNGASYSRVKVPVEHWYKFDRYVLLDVTLDSPLKLGVYFNAGSLLEHAALSAGRYKLCLDTRAYNNWESFVEDGDNILLFYCDAGSGDGVVAGNKKVTVHSISFAETAEYVSSPDSSKASVNFANETVSIEEGFEASASADFNALLENGSAIAPGSTLYVRGKDASTAATEIKLPARPTLSAADAPTPTKGENYIRFGDASFEYKMGDGEWAKTGSWGNLTAGTEYTVYVRKAATETAFRSEEVELKITTNGTKPSGGNDGDNNGGDNSEEQPAKKKCGSQVGSQAVAVGMLLVLAAGAVIVLRKRTAK